MLIRYLRHNIEKTTMKLDKRIIWRQRTLIYKKDLPEEAK